LSESRKDDTGKARYDLIPADALDHVAKLFGDGAAKYGERNWESHGGLKYGRVFAAMMRHAWAFWRGSDYDDDPVGQRQHHMASVAWCAMVLLSYTLRRIGTDDRPGLGLMATQDEAAAPAMFEAIARVQDYAGTASWCSEIGTTRHGAELRLRNSLTPRFTIVGEIEIRPWASGKTA
jgi:hypothetical protein